jgi:hypothetical protein
LTIIIVFFSTFHLSKIQQDCSKDLNPLYQYQKSNDNLGKNQSIIFIGGMPRSGTTLMRAILDSHPRVRCGEETRIIPRILSMRSTWKKSPSEWNR